MNYLKVLLKEENVKKFFSVVLLVLLIIGMKSMLNIVLFTFMFAFIFYNVQEVLYKVITKYVPIKRVILTIGIYLVAILGIVVPVYKYIPLLINELMQVGREVSTFKLDSLTKYLNDDLQTLVADINVAHYVKQGVNVLVESVSYVGGFSVQIFMALLLSFFFILEKDKIMEFGKKVEKSKAGGLYMFYKSIGTKFINSFGKVLQLQILISFINAVLSVIMLAIMGFDQVFGLGAMIFILGLIPVAGVIISFIPIAIIAFQIGGVMKVLWVIGMILILHALESYILSPKLMSIKMELPIFFTFMTLIVSEHFLGIWGLLIGLPLVMFFLDILPISDSEDNEKVKVVDSVEIVKQKQ